MASLSLARPSLLSASLWLIKRTYQPSVLKRNRKHGFLRRTRTRNGQDTIARRVAKGRHKVSVAFQGLVEKFF